MWELKLVTMMRCISPASRRVRTDIHTSQVGLSRVEQAATQPLMVLAWFREVTWW